VRSAKRGIAALAAPAFLLVSCSRAVGRGGAVPEPTVSLVKLISWAEETGGRCATDLEGSAPPASFRLRYTEAGGEPVTIENDPDQLFGAGWAVVTRSARGLGFEKAGEFSALDFDVVEELQCSCEEKGPAAAWKGNELVHVEIDWKAGEKPSVGARLGDGAAARPVEAVTMNGRLAFWEFRFAKPFPSPPGGECASHFFVALNLSQPME
jgi:hypothetical protein